MDYINDTQLAYMSYERAKQYKEQQTTRWCWARLTTWLQRRSVEKLLKESGLGASENILDLPCGTGVLADVLHKFSSQIFASDISREMMDFALTDYTTRNTRGIVLSDVLKSPFHEGSFTCVVTLGFIHRLPEQIRRLALAEITRISRKLLIISCSIDTPWQRRKQWLLTQVWPAYRAAPSAASMQALMRELDTNGLRVRKKITIMPFFSAEAVFLLEKITLSRCV